MSMISLAFKVGGAQRTQYKSFMNQRAASIAKILIDTIDTFRDGLIKGVGMNEKGDILIEMQSHNGVDSHIFMTTKEFDTIVYKPKKQPYDSNYISYHIFIPLFIQVLLYKKFNNFDGDGLHLCQEFETSFRDYMDNNSQAGRDRALDSFYFIARDGHICNNLYDIVQEEPNFSSFVMKEDLLPEIMGVPSKFTVIKTRKRRTTKKNSIPKDLNEYKSGLKLTKRQEALVPKLDLSTIEIHPKIYLLMKGMVKGLFNNAMFYGPPATGKSLMGKVMAQVMGLPLYVINLEKNSEKGNIIGRWLPDPKEPNKFIWKDGQFTEAYRKGGVVLMEEFNFADAGVIGGLHSALDTTRLLELDNGEIIERHPNCYILFTTNVNLAGTRRMNQATLSRDDLIIEFEALREDQISKIILTQSALDDKNIADGMAWVINGINQYMQQAGIDAWCTVRHGISWANSVFLGESVQDASWDTILAGTTLDSDMKKTLYEMYVVKKFGA